MMRRIALAGVTAALALGGIAVAAGPAGAAAKPPIFNATGTLHCSITGKVKINPPLTNANTLPSTTTAKLKGTCSGTTGNPVVTPSGVKGSVLSVGTSAGYLRQPGDAGHHPVHGGTDVQGERRQDQPVDGRRSRGSRRSSRARPRSGSS